LPTCAPIANRRKPRVSNPLQDVILPHFQTGTLRGIRGCGTVP
jgi:hypothetical protein